MLPRTNCGGHSTWEDQLCDLLFPEWSPTKQLKLREWLQHRKLTKMVQTLDAMPSAPDVRNRIIKSVLRGTGAPPELFKRMMCPPSQSTWMETNQNW